MAKTNQNVEFRAEARFQRSSPQKAKLVLDLIKGKRVENALNIVAFSDKRIAGVIESTLRSAVQNALYLSDERGLDIDADALIVKVAVANEGPRLKRLRPAPMGRAFRYQRRLTHIVITVAEKTSGQEGGANASSQKAAKGKKASSTTPQRAAAGKAAVA